MMTSDGLRQLHSCRVQYVKAVLSQEVGWFDLNNSGVLAARISGCVARVSILHHTFFLDASSFSAVPLSSTPALTPSFLFVFHLFAESERGVQWRADVREVSAQ